MFIVRFLLKGNASVEAGTLSKNRTPKNEHLLLNSYLKYENDLPKTIFYLILPVTTLF